MDIAIFGAGVAGLMAAVALQAQGHRCRIYESRADLADGGMGFILMPEGARALEAAGLSIRSHHFGTALRDYIHRRSDGSIVHAQPMPDGARGVLRRELLEMLRAQLPVAGIQFDAGLEHLEFDARQQVLHARLSHGRTVRADLYLCADGVHSKAREAMFPAWPHTLAQVWEVVGLTRCPQVVAWTNRNFNKFHDARGGLAFGLLPLDASTAVWYLQYDTLKSGTEMPRAPDALRQFLQKQVGHWAHPIPQLLAQTESSRTHLWRALDIDLVPQFHRANLALLGDAAHPMSPFSSQGVSAAMADAVALAAALREPAALSASLPAALARYSQQRRAACLPSIAKGRELMRHFLAPPSRGTPLIPVV